MPPAIIAYVVSSLGLKLPESEKTPYLEEERKLRAQYHIDAEHWKRNAQGGQEGKCGQIETENNDGLAEHARLTDHLCLPDHRGSVELSGKQHIMMFLFNSFQLYQMLILWLFPVAALFPVASTRGKKRTRVSSIRHALLILALQL
jgi:hypothetical protein